MIELKSATGKTFLTISYEQKNNLIFNNWIGYASTENIIQGSVSFLEMLKEKNCPYSITNNREFAGPWDSSLDWLCNEWVPAAKAAGLQFYAHVVNKGSFAEAAAHELAGCVNNSFEMQVFESLSDARDWIKEKMNVAAHV